MSEVALQVAVTGIANRTTVVLRDATTGQGKTGLVAADLTAAWSQPGSIATDIPLTNGTIGAAYSAGSIKEIDAVKQPGAYQFDVPAGPVAAGLASLVMIIGAGVLDKEVDITLLPFNPATVDKTEMILAATGLDLVLDAANAVGTLSLRNVQLLIAAWFGGKRNGVTTDGTAGTAHIRNPEDTKNRISIGHDGHGNWLTVTFDLT